MPIGHERPHGDRAPARCVKVRRRWGTWLLVVLDVLALAAVGGHSLGGDGVATVSRAEQQSLTVAATLRLLRSLEATRESARHHLAHQSA